MLGFLFYMEGDEIRHLQMPSPNPTGLQPLAFLILGSEVHTLYVRRNRNMRMSVHVLNFVRERYSEFPYREFFLTNEEAHVPMLFFETYIDRVSQIHIAFPDQIIPEDAVVLGINGYIETTSSSGFEFRYMISRGLKHSMGATANFMKRVYGEDIPL